jgi:glyceraldehyde 3-phosphate dehydrogenase
MLGEDAAVVIEAVETHTRTGFVDIQIPESQPGGASTSRQHRIPVTHIKVFGWYDNEMGSYTHRLGELTGHIARSM